MKGNSTPTADQAKVRVLVADDHPVVRHGIMANVKPQPDMTVLAEVKTSRLPCKIIIMTTFDSEEDVQRAMKAGARGYLLKDSTQEEILDAIRRVSLGETYLPARIVQKVAEGMRKPELSPREAEVLQWVAAGKSNKEIGTQLFIAEGTVKTHVK